MSHHSDQSLPPDLTERLQKSAGALSGTPDELKLGATGEFPEGKLTDDDEGEIKIGIAHMSGKVILDFGTSVTWIGFTPEQAEQIAHTLIEKAAKAKE